MRFPLLQAPRALPRSRTALSALCALYLALAVSSAPAQEEDLGPRGCATIRAMQQSSQAGQAGVAGGKNGTSARIAQTVAVDTARTYVTPHFAIHYSLAPSVHRIRWITQQSSDVALKAKVDSLFALPSSGSARARDGRVYAKLDSMGLGHPQYILKAGEYFERAWTYYDSLGMRMPDSSKSRAFFAPGYQRMAVDIADIGTADAEYHGEAYYGIAYPPRAGQSSTMLVENDFLYSAAYNAAANQVQGTAVVARLNGVVYRNYSTTDWDMGLRVTIFHEFYHAVQYEYTPTFGGSIHAWYELSAVSMEERLAPDVNDYFQYLPYSIARNQTSPLWTPPPQSANYGQGVFHMFLSKKAGNGFDRDVWESLADTNNLPKALLAVFGQARWDSLYSAYAAAMTLSGTPAAASSPLAFNPDMPVWPKPYFDTVPAAGNTQLMLPAGTFRLVRAPAAGLGKSVHTTLPHVWRVDSSAAGHQARSVPGTSATFGKPSVLALANPGFSGSRQVTLSRATSVSTNPVQRNATQVRFFAVSGVATDSLRIFSESGRDIATLPLDGSGEFWDWNLKDRQNRTVPSGIYFFIQPGQTPNPLLILP